MIVLDDGFLISMTSNSTYRTKFPFIATLATSLASVKTGSSCSACAMRQQNRQSLNAAKQAIAMMPDDGKRELKQALAADKVQVTYLNAAGGIVRLEF